MTAATEQENPVFFDLSARSKLRIGGSDRLRFLNGQITNDARKSTTERAIAGAILNARGKMDAFVYLSQGADWYFIDADPELQEKLPARLGRYVIADDVELADITSQFALFHVLSDAPLPDEIDASVVRSDRFGLPGVDLWVEMDRHHDVFAQLSGVFSFRDGAALEIFRIEQGIPRWTRELTEEIIPPEANLETVAVDYEKGCYIGQEIVSRMKMSGQRNKKLTGFISVYNAPLEAGMKIYPVGEEKKEAGWITSAVHSRRLGKEIALGYLKRPFYHAGFRLDAKHPEDIGKDPVRIEIADLPFQSAAPQK
jgi:folate-binding protein YgfZ